MTKKGIKCASWCGRGCTKAEWEEARSGSKALVKELGPGWRPRVWENLGWHYSAVNGHVNVHPDRVQAMSAQTGKKFLVTRPFFTAFISVDLDSSGGRWFDHGKTPKQAVEKAVRRFMDEFVEMTALGQQVLKETRLVIQQPLKKCPTCSGRLVMGKYHGGSCPTCRKCGSDFPGRTIAKVKP